MDISGFWAGTYFYPDGILSPVSFDAEFTQNGALLSGQITEDNTIDFLSGTLLSARINGHIVGQSIYFTKTYANSGLAKHVVFYTGQVTADATEISGYWDILAWGGSFKMNRDRGNLIGADISGTKTKVIV